MDLLSMSPGPRRRGSVLAPEQAEQDAARGVMMAPRPLPATMRPEATAPLSTAASEGQAGLMARPTVDIAHTCGQEIAAYLRGEAVAGTCGFELFRRAIVQRDEDAWAALHAQFAPFVHRWLGLRPQDAATAELSAATFERLWQALTPARFSRFPSLAAVLRYLQLCAQSVRLDRLRAARRQACEGPLDATADERPAADNPAEQVRQAQEATAFWRTVQACLGDERERTVLYLCYVRGLEPREICARYSTHFPAVADVYRLKRRALLRLRHAPALRALLSPLGAAVQ